LATLFRCCFNALLLLTAAARPMSAAGAAQDSDDLAKKLVAQLTAAEKVAQLVNVGSGQPDTGDSATFSTVASAPLPP
jgi:hypothetical protein